MMPLYRSKLHSPLEATWSPPPDLLAWYKVNEGGGTTIYNYAPAGVNKLPNVNTVVQNSNFWSQSSGFGYWDISPIVTQVYATWVAMLPFSTKAGTVMIFGKEARVTNDGTPTAALYNINVSAGWYWNFYSGLSNIHHMVNMDSTYLNDVTVAPASSFYNKSFVQVFTHDTVQTQVEKVKYVGDAAWRTDTKTSVTGFNNPSGITSVFIGCAIGAGYLGDPENTWKGTLGDLLIWNVLLTDAQIDDVVANLGGRWGF